MGSVDSGNKRDLLFALLRFPELEVNLTPLHDKLLPAIVGYVVHITSRRLPSVHTGEPCSIRRESYVSNKGLLNGVTFVGNVNVCWLCSSQSLLGNAAETVEIESLQQGSGEASCQSSLATVTNTHMKP